jgi:hypothetical protein
LLVTNSEGDGNFGYARGTSLTYRQARPRCCGTAKAGAARRFPREQPARGGGGTYGGVSHVLGRRKQPPMTKVCWFRKCQASPFNSSCSSTSQHTSAASLSMTRPSSASARRCFVLPVCSGTIAPRQAFISHARGVVSAAARDISDGGCSAVRRVPIVRRRTTRALQQCAIDAGPTSVYWYRSAASALLD